MVRKHKISQMQNKKRGGEMELNKNLWKLLDSDRDMMATLG